MRKPNGPEWFALVVFAGVVVLLVHDYCTDHGDTEWTNPPQPPPMVAPLLGTPGARAGYGMPYRRDYAPSLTDDQCCVVGDC